MTSSIETVAKAILDQREQAVAFRFARLMEESHSAIEPLVTEILPVYYRSDRTLDPQSIYRTLMYVYIDAYNGDSRGLIYMAGQHIESCLEYLGGYNLPLGALIQKVYRKGIISHELATQLSLFNKVVSIPTKHMASIREIESQMNKRTFSYLDAAYTFMMMRKLSIALFVILMQNGISLPEDWKAFNPSWTT